MDPARIEDRAVSLYRQGHPVFPHAVLARDAPVLRSSDADERVRARLSHRGWREDVQVAWHLHYGEKHDRYGYQSRVAALLLRREAEPHDGRHRPESRRFSGAREQRSGRQVREYREPRGGLPDQAFRRPRAGQRDESSAAAAIAGGHSANRGAI